MPPSGYLGSKLPPWGLVVIHVGGTRGKPPFLRSMTGGKVLRMPQQHRVGRLGLLPKGLALCASPRGERGRLITACGEDEHICHGQCLGDGLLRR